MKKATLLLLLFISISSSIFAQFEKGDTNLEGSMSVYYNSQEQGAYINSLSQKTNSSQTRILIIPKLERFTSDNRSFLIGLGLSFSNNIAEQFIYELNEFVELEQKNTSYLASIGLRQYFPITEKILFRGGIESMIGFGKNSEKSLNSPRFISDANTLDLNLIINLGFSLPLSERFLVTLSANSIDLAFQRQTRKNSDLPDLQLDNIDITANITKNLGLGFSYRF